MDVAASEFYDNKDKTYDLNFKEEVEKTFFQIILFEQSMAEFLSFK